MTSLMCCGLYLLNTVAHGAPIAAEQLLTQATQQQLATHPEWRRLLYFSATKPQTGDDHSQVTQTEFFNATDGRTNPAAELAATLQGLLQPVTQADQSVACRFPARRAWLADQLGIDADQAFPAANCPIYQRWYGEVRPHQTTIIFATDFLNNPSSMFGHTLLRIDSEPSPSKALVSYAINYSAQTATENSIGFVWKGLTGGYDSAFSLMPYFEKVKEYGDLESRDLWEYTLNFSPAETERLVQHVWEMRHVKFPYYFLSENCSYALLGLLDIVRPSLNLQADFPAHVIPAQTVKALAAHPDLIAQTTYRPALETQLFDQAQQHGAALAKTAHQLADDLTTPITQLSAEDQAKVQEMAYDDLYLRFLARKVDKAPAQTRLRQLLVQRSQNPAPAQRQPVATPAVNPATGHDSQRIQLGIGHLQSEHHAALEWRLAYHDLLDPVGGYRAGAQMNFLRTQLLVRDDQVRLQALDLLNIDSFSPITPFATPLSWGFNLNWQQEALDADGAFDPTQQEGVGNLHGQVGYSLGDPLQQLCYAQVQANLQAGSALMDGWRMGAGARLGCLAHLSPTLRSQINLYAPYWHDQQAWQLSADAGLQWDLNRRHALRLTGQYQRQRSADFGGGQLSWVRYF
ncbi:MAG: DUF4105 domain-containing protein [Pseudomonadota bacterium]|nr:DUF4105 domain-containing protein [Pseudomonadota bacterium]